VGPKASPSSFVVMPNFDSQESLHTTLPSPSSLSFHCSSAPSFLFQTHQFVIFFHLISSSTMVDATPLLAMIMLSLLFLYLSIANEVHCYEEKPLSLQRFQWKQHSGKPSCLSRKSSEFGQREKVKKVMKLLI
jgi:hypothetical protein